ncbi:MAG: super-infection exclusion protein B [Candidatus Woesearchaeota archaeon]
MEKEKSYINIYKLIKPQLRATVFILGDDKFMDFSFLKNIPQLVISLFNLSSKFHLVFSFIIGFLLFGPNKFIEELGLAVFINDYRAWFGLMFLIFTAAWIFEFIIFFYNKFRKRVIEYINFRRGKKRLNNLAINEKEILQEYLRRDSRTQKLDESNGTVKELEKLGIIYSSADYGDFIYGFSYNLQPWVWNYLKNNLELIDLDNDDKLKKDSVPF